MSAIWHGSTDFASLGYKLTNERPSYDSDIGTTWEQTFEGTQTGIAALASALFTSGAKIRWEQKVGTNQLIAQWGRNPNDLPEDEPATDNWKLDQEPYQIPLFRHPLAALEAEAYIGSSFAQYRKDITSSAEAGTAYPLDTGSFPVGLQIYYLLGQGVEYWETQRPILSRQREFSKTYPSKQVVAFTSKVYTRATLIASGTGFGIPASFEPQIPADPSYSPPTGTSWGWRLRQQSSGYSKNTRRWEEQIEWEFGWWYNSLYEIL